MRSPGRLRHGSGLQEQATDMPGPQADRPGEHPAGQVRGCRPSVRPRRSGRAWPPLHGRVRRRVERRDAAGRHHPPGPDRPQENHRGQGIIARHHGAQVTSAASRITGNPTPIPLPTPERLARWCAAPAASTTATAPIAPDAQISPRRHVPPPRPSSCQLSPAHRAIASSPAAPAGPSTSDTCATRASTTLTHARTATTIATAQPTRLAGSHDVPAMKAPSRRPRKRGCDEITSETITHSDGSSVVRVRQRPG